MSGSTPQHGLMRLYTACLLALVGCSGAVAVSGDDDDDAGEVTPDRDSGAQTTRPDATASSSSSTSSSGSTSSSSGGSSGSTSSSSSGEADSGPDASDEDAGEDASADASADASQDAAPDAPAPVCDVGQERCVSYHEEACVAGQWARQAGEDCCFTEGRYVDNGAAADGAKWYTDNPFVQFVNKVYKAPSLPSAWSTCSVMHDGHLLTRAQLLQQVLPSDGACSPGFDEHIFREDGGDVTSTVFFVRPSPNEPDSAPVCVDVATGADVGCATVAKPAFVCGLF